MKAREIIRQGIAKENIEDFAEEFCSYWIIDCDSAAESILTLPDKPTTICAYYSRQTKKVYLSNRKKELDHYIPYGAFDLKRFIYEFLSYLLFNNIPKEKKGNYLFTWCGNIPEVQKAGGIIAPKWSDASPYSSHIKRID